MSRIWYRVMPPGTDINASLEGQGVSSVALNDGETIDDLKRAAKLNKVVPILDVPFEVYAGDGSGKWVPVDADEAVRTDSTARKDKKEYRIVVQAQGPSQYAPVPTATPLADPNYSTPQRKACNATPTKTAHDLLQGHEVGGQALTPVQRRKLQTANPEDDGMALLTQHHDH